MLRDAARDVRLDRPSGVAAAPPLAPPNKLLISIATGPQRKGQRTMPQRIVRLQKRLKPVSMAVSSHVVNIVPENVQPIS